MSEDYTPLDPDEGPTIWARQVENDKHTVMVAQGTDPSDPYDTFLLSANEIKRLEAMVTDE